MRIHHSNESNAGVGSEMPLSTTPSRSAAVRRRTLDVPFGFLALDAEERGYPVGVDSRPREQVRRRISVSPWNDPRWYTVLTHSLLFEAVDVGVQLRKLEIFKDNALVAWCFEPILSMLFMRERPRQFRRPEYTHGISNRSSKLSR